MRKARHCEVCGRELPKPKARPLCQDCAWTLEGGLVEARRKRRLAGYRHPVVDLGRGKSGALLERHVRGKELAEVARCRAECGLPAVWDGRRWTRGKTSADCADGPQIGTTEDTDHTE